LNRHWPTAIALALLVAACSFTTTEGIRHGRTVTITFDGDDCSYNGPDEFDLDTELTINLTNEAGTSVGLGVWKVPDGTTAEDIETQGMLRVGGSVSQNERAIRSPGSASEWTLIVELNEAGTWAFNCFNFGSPGFDYPTIVEVQ
jgi:hypothetical protein